MAVDQYATCPCGSGKKIKFCKCFESIGELDKVMKMVGGGQKVAAIDRLNQILQQHPDAAWALAIKGRLLISFNELDSLAENADRFIRLQPSNPLALAQKAASQVFTGKLTEAAHSILEALAESGRGIDSFLLEIISILSVALANQRSVLSARLYASLPLLNRDFEDSSLAETVLGELNRDGSLNLLMKTLPVAIDRPESVSWAERFDEAQSLLYNHQILAAESKLEALDRQFSNEPAIISGLLSCATWRADAEAQVRLLRKLSGAVADDPEQSARLLAMSYLSEPDQESLTIDGERLEYTIDSAEPVTLALAANPLCRSIPAEVLQRASSESEEVPPRAGFQLLSRPLPEADEPLTVENLPSSIGLVRVYGRQTDRAPRVLVDDVAPKQRAKIREILGDAIDPQQQPTSTPVGMHFTALIAPNFVIAEGRRTDAATALVVEAMRDQARRELVDVALPVTGGKPLGSLADDPSTLTVRTAVMRILQGQDMLVSEIPETLDEVCQRLGVPVLSTLHPTNDDQLEELTAFDLLQVDPADLNPDGLFYLFQRAQQVHCTNPLRSAGRRIVSLDSVLAQGEGDQEQKGRGKEMVLRAYVMLVQTAHTPEEAQEISERAKAWCVEYQVPDATLLLNDLYRHLETGDVDAFHRTIETVTSKYGNNETVMAHLQQLLINVGLLNPDGTPRRSPRPAAGSQLMGAGGQRGASPPASAPGAAAASPGGSKLWLPGMD